MIIRAFNAELETRAKEGRTREFVISTERPDSHRSVIKMDGWNLDDYNRAGTVYYMHQTGTNALGEANINNALGVGSAYKENNRLIGVAMFEPESLNPLAETVLGKVDFGTLKRTSVGFIPHKGKGHWGKEDRGEDPTLYYFEGQTLVEFSIVDIGSNLDAVKKSMESMDKFLFEQIDMHDSEGAKKDLKRWFNTKRYMEYIENLQERRNIF